MSKVFIEETTLSAIGSAIREMTGKSDLIAPTNMPTEIRSIETGGGGGGEDIEPIVLTGDCDYTCGGAVAGAYIKNFGDKISTNNVGNIRFMFINSPLSFIPFEINCDNSRNYANETFSGCINLIEVPKINNFSPYNIGKFFRGCFNLRYLPEDFGANWNWTEQHTTQSLDAGGIFDNCFSLRKVPNVFLSNIWGIQTTSLYSPYKNTFNACFALDEIKNIPIHPAKITGNMFGTFVSECLRLKTFTFATNEDGSPKEATWKSQTLDLSTIGYTLSYGSSRILNYNSGITADKEVKDDATYQALKNDPDWFSTTKEYSRYNHDSAVNTINSLPDTSAYLASAGGTNTVKFKGEAGSLTDGGAINTLTEEEIAVATAKGWTVSLT